MEGEQQREQLPGEKLLMATIDLKGTLERFQEINVGSAQTWDFGKEYKVGAAATEKLAVAIKNVDDLMKDLLAREGEQK